MEVGVWEVTELVGILEVKKVDAEGVGVCEFDDDGR